MGIKRRMNLNHVTVTVSALEPALAFYRKLGFQPIVLAAHYARFETPDGDATFSIELGSQTAGAGAPVIYFECADLDATCAVLEGTGIAFESKPTDQTWLWREARLCDPSGNRICLYNAGAMRKHPPWRVQS